MSENTENTLSAYKGPDFQQRLMWQLLVEPEFAEKTIPNLAIEYFDDPNLKRLFIIILEYFKRYEKVPNLQNKSIHQAINEFKSPNNLIEEESLFAVIKRVELWNERIINKQMLYDGDVVQKSTTEFVKQQEYRKLGESIIEKVKSGAIRSKFEIINIEDRFHKIIRIGEEHDDCESITEGIKKALRKEFRETIPTGIETIDVLTGGGLGKGEIGVVLTPSGVGKTTFLTKVANTAYELGKNVAQIVFEDTTDQIKRKHYVIWAESSLTKINEEEEADRVEKIANEHVEYLESKSNGRLLVKRFSQEDTTIKDVKNWMLGYQKKFGFKFDILILDYLDCLESHKKSPDRNEAELAIVKGFEALAADLDIPAWTAIQSNRSGFGAEFVEAHQSGGSIKRIQKAHFFMSIAKTPAQQEANFANIRIIKARFAKDGQAFEDCVFNNDTLQIIIDDPRYKYTKTYKGLKHYDETDVEKFENQAEKLKKSSELDIHQALSKREEQILDKLNDDTVNGVMNDPQKLNDLLRENARQLVDGNPEIFKPAIESLKTEIDNDILKRITVEATTEVASTPIVNNVPDADTINSDIERMRREIEMELNGGINLQPIIKIETKDDLLELDGVIDVVNDGVSDGVNEGAVEGAVGGAIGGVEEELLDFTGDTETEATNFIEVTVENKPSIVEIPVDNRIYEIQKAVENPPITPPREENNANGILLIDPDEPEGQDKHVINMLAQLRSNQSVINKK